MTARWSSLPQTGGLRDPLRICAVRRRARSVPSSSTCSRRLITLSISLGSQKLRIPVYLDPDASSSLRNVADGTRNRLRANNARAAVTLTASHGLTVSSAASGVYPAVLPFRRRAATVHMADTADRPVRLRAPGLLPNPVCGKRQFLYALIKGLEGACEYVEGTTRLRTHSQGERPGPAGAAHRWSTR
jgi:hypothetical protein